MKIENVLTLLAAAALAMTTQAALAQASAPATRAEVKAETAQARKEGKLKPSSEAADESLSADVKKPSTKTRAERKAETAQARKEGKLRPTGDAAEAGK